MREGYERHGSTRVLIFNIVTSPRLPQDRYLPPDRTAFIDAKPATGRIIIIAPTRAACETIELAMGLHLDTVLEREHGDEIRELAANGAGFGDRRWHRHGQDARRRPIAETILGTDGAARRRRQSRARGDARYAVVERRHRHDGHRATLVPGRRHHAPATRSSSTRSTRPRRSSSSVSHSASASAAASSGSPRRSIRRFYARYLDSADVIESTAFDPAQGGQGDRRRSRSARFPRATSSCSTVYKERRGVGVFLPTRAGVEEAAEHTRIAFSAHQRRVLSWRRADPHHPAVSRRHGAQAVSARDDRGGSERAERARSRHRRDRRHAIHERHRARHATCSRKTHLGSNEILQMAGRVHGRVDGGRVFILSDRDIDFASLVPTEPEFQLAGDSERVALTCAALGVRADDLDLPVPLDRAAYRRALALLEQPRHRRERTAHAYGKAVEALPVERAWAELLVNADDELVPYVAVMSGVESLHRMTREERNLEGLDRRGERSSHGVQRVRGGGREVRPHWRGVWSAAPPVRRFDRSSGPTRAACSSSRSRMPRSAWRACIAVSACRCPTRLPYARGHVYKQFADLLARIMPFDLVIDEETRDGSPARVSKTSVCGSWGAIAGTLRYFAGKSGEPRAAIEGTQIPADLIRQYATRGSVELIYDPNRKHDQLVLTTRVEYFGFELERDVRPVREFPPELADRIRHVLAEAAAKGEARHAAMKRNRAAIEAVREAYRRSGGRTPRLGLAELTALYERQFAGVNSMEEFRNARLHVDPDEFVSEDERERLAERCRAWCSCAIARRGSITTSSTARTERRTASRGCGFRRRWRARSPERSCRCSTGRCASRWCGASADRSGRIHWTSFRTCSSGRGRLPR